MIKTLNSLTENDVVKSVVLTVATNSVIFPFLAGHDFYRLEFAIKTTASGDISMLFNGDTTETNYRYSNLAAVQTNDRAYFAYANGANGLINGTSSIKYNSGRNSAYHNIIRTDGTTITNIGIALTKTVDVTALTQIEIKGSVANMFAVGSSFKLFKC